LQTLEDRFAPATIVVNTTVDNMALDGKCSLREAITSVNNAYDLNGDVAVCRTGAYGSDTIVFDAALFSTPQTITLLSALPQLTSDVALQGTSSSNVTVTRGASAIGIFNCAANVSFSNMTISGGSAAFGAGIFAATNNNVTLANCTVSNNSAFVSGGGIFVAYGANLTATNTTVSGNSATLSGGGIDFFGTGRLAIEYSTVSGNKASGSNGGGGIYCYTNSAVIRDCTIAGNTATSACGGGIAMQIASTNVTIQNSTIANNSANTTGGGINVKAGTLNIESTIVAKNQTAGSARDIKGVVTANYSLIGISDDGPTITGASNQMGNVANPLDPYLGALANNGGPTQTMAIPIYSQAVNAGSNISAVPNDQRGPGFLRVSGGQADIGAFEIQPDFTVSNLNDSGAGSLRQAVSDANSAGGIRIIDIAAGLAGTIVLTSGEIPINTSLFMGASVAGAVTISGKGASRIFNLTSDPAGAGVSIANLTLANGTTAGNGGAIAMSGQYLALTNCVLTNNAGGSDGGAIQCNSSQGIVVARGCTFSGNQAQTGGAIDFSPNGGNLLLDGCTLSNNNATAAMGGALFVNGAVGFFGCTVRNCTISANVSKVNGGGIGLKNSAGIFWVQNSTLSLNMALAGSGGGIARTSGTGTIWLTSSIDCDNVNAAAPDLSTSGTVSAVACLIGSTTGVLTFNGDTFTNANIGVDPNLGPLQNNGGSTQTQLPAVTSKAIGNGTNPAGVTMDQRGRGFPRSVGGVIDIGAVTVRPTNLLVTNALDSGPGSLRQAIVDANANPGPDTISFDPAYFNMPRTITLTTGQLIASDRVTINGPGLALATVSGNNADRVFNFAFTAANSSLSGLTVTKGISNGFGGGIVSYGNLSVGSCVITGNAAFQCGGLSVTSGGLTLSDSLVTNNTATAFVGGIDSGAGGVIQRSTISGNSAAGSIGGLYAFNGLTLIDSTVSNNSAGSNMGGIGLIDQVGGSNVIRNCTISGNTAFQHAGGIGLGYGSGSPFNSTLTIQNCTITANEAVNGVGGGVARLFGTGTISIESSIVSGNNAFFGKDIFSSSAVVVNWSAIGNSIGFTLSGANNLPFGANLKLSPLAVNGNLYFAQALTQTPALDSPLIDQGSDPAGLVYDQRGFFRGIGNGYDIGAVEVQPTLVLSINRHDASPTAQQIVTWTVSFASFAGGLTAANFALSGPGAFGATITRVSGSGLTWNVSAATGAEGALELDMVNSNGLTFLPINLPFAGQPYLVNKLPLTISVSANPTTINDLNVGSSALTLTANFSEPMNTAITPAFSFPIENPGSSLGLASGGWINATTYQAKYNVLNTNIMLANIHAQISGVQDSGGNAVSSFTMANVFSIDTQAPIVSSITLNEPALNNLATVDWTVIFSKPVTGVNSNDFALFNGGLAGTPAITLVTGSGTTWTVKASGYAGQGTLALYMTSTAGVTDTDGNPLGALPVVGPSYSIDPIPPRVLTVQINDGSAQRSRVTSVTVTFIEPVAFAGPPAAAFSLTGPGGLVNLAVDLSASSTIETVAKLTFSGPNSEYGSLKDGRYTLTIAAAQVTDLAGNPLDGNSDGIGGDDYVLASAAAPNPPTNIFRLYGDINGDGTVSASDFNVFRQYFGGFLFGFDFDNDGAVAASDFIQFRLRFGGSI
jgi:CSLREA domain-containing protein